MVGGGDDWFVGCRGNRVAGVDGKCKSKAGPWLGLG